MALAPIPTFLQLLTAAALSPFGGVVHAACDVSGAATTAHDFARARSACEAAQAEFAALFGGPAPRVLIVLHDAHNYELGLVGDVGVVFWPNGAALGEGPDGTAEDAARATAFWREVLPHEVMHALTMARFFAGERVDEHGGYGTPLPDWFEEGIAIRGEPAPSREARVEQARRLPASWLDLGTVLRSAHPAAGASLMAPVPGAPPPADPAMRAFYPAAIALFTFVLETGGAEAVRHLADRLVRDPANQQALAGLPGFPDRMEDVVIAWNRWIRLGDGLH